MSNELINEYGPEITPPSIESREELLKKHGGNLSAVIRELHKNGMKTGEIAKHLNIIYQHARNTIKRPLKRG